MGQCSTKAAVSLMMLGGSGCSSSGVTEMRPLPRFVVTMETLELLVRSEFSVASAASILLPSVSTNALASRGCSIAA